MIIIAFTQVLESSGILSEVVSFFYDKNLTLIDSLLDEHVRKIVYGCGWEC